MPSLHVPSLSPRVCSNSCPLSPWCHPAISSSLPLLFLPSNFTGTRVFSNELVLPIRWSMYWSFSLTISHFNEYSGLISYRADRFDLPAVQGTLKGFLQHHSSKATILWCSSFFMFQLSHPYMTTGKSIALTIWTFIGKLMSLLSNKLSRFLTAFLPRRKHILISWLQSLAAVSFGPQENKVCHCFYFLPIYLNEVLDWMSWSSFFECWVWSQIFFTLLFHLHQQTL